MFFLCKNMFLEYFKVQVQLGFFYLYIYIYNFQIEVRKLSVFSLIMSVR